MLRHSKGADRLIQYRAICRTVESEPLDGLWDRRSKI